MQVTKNVKSFFISSQYRVIFLWSDNFPLEYFLMLSSQALPNLTCPYAAASVCIAGAPAREGEDPPKPKKLLVKNRVMLRGV